MANNVVQQSKRKGIVIAPETTVGTVIDANAIASSGVIIPGVVSSDIKLNHNGRGTGMIARDAVSDAYGGGLEGVVGSAGYTLDFNCEIQEITQTNKLPYFAKLLHACGMSGTTANSGGATYFTMIPSNAAIAGYGTDNYTAKTPCSISAYVLDYNDGVNETYQVSHGTVGTFNLMATSNEVAKLEFSMKGLLPEVTPRVINQTATTALSTTGSFDTGSPGIPLKLLGASVELYDLGASETVTLTNLKSIKLSANFDVDDVVDPQSYNGYATSPVFCNKYSTVDMSFAVTSDTDSRLMDGWIAGNKYRLTYSLKGTNRKVTVNIPQMQAMTLTKSDEGMRMYTIQFNVFRDGLGGTTYPFQFTYEDI